MTLSKKRTNTDSQRRTYCTAALPWCASRKPWDTASALILCCCQWLYADGQACPSASATTSWPPCSQASICRACGTEISRGASVGERGKIKKKVRGQHNRKCKRVGFKLLLKPTSFLFCVLHEWIHTKIDQTLCGIVRANLRSMKRSQGASFFRPIWNTPGQTPSAAYFLPFFEAQNARRRYKEPNKAHTHRSSSKIIYRSLSRRRVSTGAKNSRCTHFVQCCATQ